MCVCVMVLTQVWRRGHSTNTDLRRVQREKWNLFCSFQAKSFEYEECNLTLRGIVTCRNVLWGDLCFSDTLQDIYQFPSKVLHS